MMNIALLGDSIFDNAHYINSGEKALADQVRIELKNGEVLLLARDGSVTDDVVEQIQVMSARREAITHLVISSGGNDALFARGALISADTARSLLETVTVVQTKFQIAYEKLMLAAKKTELSTVVCTIYNCVPGLQPFEKTLLSIFNDVIVFQAARFRVPVIDLRLTCTDPRDYSEISPIEPSAQGGMKIAKKIVAVVQGFNFKFKHTIVV